MAAVQALVAASQPHTFKSAEAHFTRAYPQLSLIISKHREREHVGGNRVRRGAGSVVNNVAKSFMREKHFWRAGEGKQPGAGEAERQTQREPVGAE